MRARVPRVVFGLSVGLLLVTVPVLADAPIDPPQYEAFLSEDDTVVDRYTELEWARRIPNAADKTSSGLHCTNQAFDGVGRLPTIKELHTIFDEEPHAEYDTRPAPPGNKTKYLDTRAFGDGLGVRRSPIDKPYWSQTPSPTPNKFWALDFTTGAMVELDPTDPAYVRCVR